MTDSPRIGVSWGEFFDRLCILEIKQERLASSGARAAAAQQIAQLKTSTAPMPSQEGLRALVKDLRGANEKLWDLENQIRACEAVADFGPRFVEVARSIYITNDERIALKGKIDEICSSEIAELREYARYGKGGAG
ncbi:MAG: hypothetical protein JOZ55_09980 [Alphaproteobacteria bacterium]|nr:hypothetical protein [Alphaproteobacteria bacterium]